MPHRRDIRHLAQRVFDRDGWRCYLCGRGTDRTVSAIDPAAPSVDHLVPLSQGGSDGIDNLRCACRRCNMAKGQRKLLDSLMIYIDTFDRRGVRETLPELSLDDLCTLWRHYRFDGEREVNAYGLQDHPLIVDALRSRIS